MNFREGDLVLLENRRRRHESSSNLQPPFCGADTVFKVFPNHTYKIDSLGQASVKGETRLKLHTSAEIVEGKAPVTKEACSCSCQKETT